MCSFFRKSERPDEESAPAGAWGGGTHSAAPSSDQNDRPTNPRHTHPATRSPSATKNTCHASSVCTLAAGTSATPASRAAQRRLAIALALSLVFVVAEFTGGALAHSLAVVSDAAHMLSDAAGLLTALVAARVGNKAASANGGHTFGYHRVEVLGALASTLITYIVTTVLVVEAVGRIKDPRGVDGRLMTIMGIVAVAFNFVMLAVLGGDHGHHHHGHGHGHGHDEGHGHARHGHEEAHSHSPRANAAADTPATPHAHAHRHHTNINLRGAFVHVLGDCVQSVGVVVAGAIIWAKPHLSILDPLLTLLFAILVILTTIRLMRDVADILLERAPRGGGATSPGDVHAALAAVPGVACVHDLHVWQLKPGIPLVSAHVTHDGTRPSGQVLAAATAALAAVGLGHATIQVASAEDEGACQAARTAAAEVDGNVAVVKTE